jgi:hypothetical protein
MSRQRILGWTPTILEKPLASSTTTRAAALEVASTRACLQSANFCASATKHIESLSPRKPALSAAVNPRTPIGTPITFALPSLVRLSRKVSDEFTVPLCRIHHREVHRGSDEAAWWSRFGVDPFRSGRRPQDLPLDGRDEY